jgi:hypothetical protein
MENAKTLTKTLAGQFMKDDESLTLYEFTSIDDDAAEVLSKYRGSLDLRGLVSLTTKAADALSTHKGDGGDNVALCLDSLENIPLSALESLCKHSGSLVLGLTSVTTAMASLLGKHKGELELRSLEELSDSDAAALGSHCGGLNLSGLTSLSDKVAQCLAAIDGALNLNGLRTLSDSAAQSLSALNGSLYLAQLTELSDEGAYWLGQHRHYLALSSLHSFARSLSDKAVQSLSKHPNLYVSGPLERRLKKAAGRKH